MIHGRDAYISSGYTRALATTAPKAPATAYPHGGRASLDCAPIFLLCL